jgi:hypothetical protein
MSGDGAIADAKSDGENSSDSAPTATPFKNPRRLALDWTCGMHFI